MGAKVAQTMNVTRRAKHAGIPLHETVSPKPA